MSDVHAKAFESDCEYAYLLDGETIGLYKNGHVNFETGASGETNSLPAPGRSGQEVFLNCVAHGGGNRVITATAAVNQTGNNTLTFGAARDNILLRSIRTGDAEFKWQVIHNDGVALSTV